MSKLRELFREPFVLVSVFFAPFFAYVVWTYAGGFSNVPSGDVFRNLGPLLAWVASMNLGLRMTFESAFTKSPATFAAWLVLTGIASVSFAAVVGYALS